VERALLALLVRPLALDRVPPRLAALVLPAAPLDRVAPRALVALPALALGLAAVRARLAGLVDLALAPELALRLVAVPALLADPAAAALALAARLVAVRRARLTGLDPVRVALAPLLDRDVPRPAPSADVR
jgi:hypothetical protein